MSVIMGINRKEIIKTLKKLGDVVIIAKADVIYAFKKEFFPNQTTEQIMEEIKNNPKGYKYYQVGDIEITEISEKKGECLLKKPHASAVSVERKLIEKCQCPIHRSDEQERLKLGMTKEEYKKYKEGENWFSQNEKTPIGEDLMKRIMSHKSVPMDKSKYKTEKKDVLNGLPPAIDLDVLLNKPSKGDGINEIKICPKCGTYYKGTHTSTECAYHSGEEDLEGKIDCNKCNLYAECDHQGAYKKDGKWCYEVLGGEKVERESIEGVIANESAQIKDSPPKSGDDSKPPKQSPCCEDCIKRNGTREYCNIYMCKCPHWREKVHKCSDCDLVAFDRNDKNKFVCLHESFRPEAPIITKDFICPKDLIVCRMGTGNIKNQHEFEGKVKREDKKKKKG